jgi:D-proline reductase (dithiol) PrdB
VTSGGLYHHGFEPPFDLERERREPTWGDPTYRILLTDIQSEEIGVSHLHLNTQDILKDVNILLPIHRFKELVLERCIGGLARYAYSFMGYQGFPPNTTPWEETYGPQVAEKLKEENVDCVLLTPA